MSGGDDQTPLMKQYWELKAQAGDALLLFRMGDFYELFGDDAVEAARILEITLTSRDRNKPNPTPMAGVPHHSVAGYIQRLLRAGKKVAIGEQMEDPSKVTGKNIVRRDITRTFTPGVQFDLEGSEANYLAAVVASEDRWVLACLDASTGETLIGEPMDADSVVDEFTALPIRHVLRFHDALAAEPFRACFELLSNSGVLIEELPTNYLGPEQAEETLKRQYGLESLGAFVEARSAIHALGVLVTYTLRTQRQEKLSHLRLPAPLHQPKTLVLGPRTAQHLDLIPDAEGSLSLYQLINQTKCALGARQLKRWLLSPLRNTSEISARQDSIRELAASQAHLAGRIAQELSKIYDLERISGRVNAKLANPRDTLALGKSLAALADLSALLQPFKTALLGESHWQFARLHSRLGALAQRIVTTQKDDAPLVARDGGIFATGTNPELDRLISLTEDGQRWLIDLETREREATGIPSLKVRYNRVFGYYIEVTQAHLKNVPSHYQRKQTTVGAERFFTEELKKFEDEIVHASARQKALELQLFEELLTAIQSETAAIMEAASALGSLDALLALSKLADLPGWTFPEINDSLELAITGGRHPLVDQSRSGAARGSFVPNDVQLSPSTRLTLMITGPNMGGKSTVMRQTALIIILGQMGAPVPATQAKWGAVSAVYTRIGAHDAIARGQSTFMVEMSELAHILHHADERSLIVLDEIGRGTSTYDGISVAWSTLEWICTKIRARTLFATHYHELTRLSRTLPLLANAHMAVESSRASRGASLRFLYQLREGPANESFGIHVARIAGLPKNVIDRAWKVLEELESHAASGMTSDTAHSSQLSLFASAASSTIATTEMPTEPEPPHPVLTELENIDINEMTPIQALNFVAKLREMSREPSEASS